jgi:hypothetical protein
LLTAFGGDRTGRCRFAQCGHRNRKQAAEALSTGSLPWIEGVKPIGAGG